MTRRLLLSLLLGASPLVAGAELRDYQVRLVTATDGAAQATVRLDLDRATPGPLSIPLGFKAIEDLQLGEAPAGTRLALGPTNGQLLLHAHLPEGVPPTCQLTFRFRVPQAFLPTEPAPGEKPTLAAGNRLFRHAFVQTQEGILGHYRLEVLFPEGLMAQGIREALPKPKRTEVQPRVRLERLEGRQAAVLQMDAIKQGDDTALLLELTPERKSLGWLVAGAAMAVLYLVAFRDLVRPAKP